MPPPFEAVRKVAPLSRLVSIFTLVPACAVCTHDIEDVDAFVEAGKVNMLTRVPVRKRRSVGLTIAAPPFSAPLLAFAVRSFALPALKFQYAARLVSLPCSSALKLS